MKIDMIITYRKKHFGINFSEEKIEEVSFEKAFGHDVFDWDNNIFIGSEWCKQEYERARGEYGVGWIGKIVAIAWEGHPLLEKGCEN